jgi:hypothetical protein
MSQSSIQKTVAAFAFATVSFVSTTATAADPIEGGTPARDEPAAAAKTDADNGSRFIGHGAAILRANPGQIQVLAGLDYHHVLEADERGERMYLQAGGGFTATQAYIAPELHLEMSPHPIVAFRGQYDLIGYYGANRGLLSLPGKGAAFGETVLDNAETRGGVGQRAAFQVKVKNQLGPVHIRAKTDISYYGIRGENGDGGVYYEPEHDTLIKQNDVIVNSRTEALFKPWSSGKETGLYLGPFLESTYAVRTETSRMRLGGTIAFRPAERWGAFGRPMVALDAGVNVSDKNREGEAFGALMLGSQF